MYYLYSYFLVFLLSELTCEKLGILVEVLGMFFSIMFFKLYGNNFRDY